MSNNKPNPYRTLDTAPIKAPLVNKKREPKVEKTVFGSVKNKGGK